MLRLTTTVVAAAAASSSSSFISSSPPTTTAGVSLTSAFLRGNNRRFASRHSNHWFKRVNTFATRMAGSGSVQASASSPRLIDAGDLVDSVETFIFDCDGVIWKGDSLIDGVPQTLDMLRAKGKRLVFVTNNSTKSRKQYGKKFETLGLSVGEEEIFASSFAAAAYLKSIDFPKDKKVIIFLLNCLYNNFSFLK
ncbi:hypothetical protein ZOSMA_208G00040 [Zostera marina]|uniref:Phosphoglycolate phosphatase n=1 Tax=Zostera marina TaxID=29655 RepID=A0A0K9PKY2_ZOSMR|nr:hypothetical protein ZOSMA_208G00040 [Zostera marina]